MYVCMYVYMYVCCTVRNEQCNISLITMKVSTQCFCVLLYVSLALHLEGVQVPTSIGIFIWPCLFRAYWLKYLFFDLVAFICGFVWHRHAFFLFIIYLLNHYLLVCHASEFVALSDVTISEWSIKYSAKGKFCSLMFY